MKTTLTTIFLFISNLLTAQNVNIPDTNFKNYLLNNSSVNTNNDSEIQISEASAFTGTLAFQFYSISDLTGIEAFTNLTILDCGDNNLTSLDLSQNTALTQLYCYDNQITNLDLSNNFQLTALDCRNNLLTALDLSNNLNVTYLQCTYNMLTSIDVSQNTSLQTLRCFNNNLTSLNLLGNSALTNLYCSYNNLTSLDLSLNQSLTEFECNYNDLTTLYMENGNNINVTVFSALNNPNLDCIQVDDEIYSTTNWTNVDTTTAFSEDCNALSVDEFDISDFSLYPNPANNILQLNFKDEAITYSILSIQGQVISNGKLQQNNNRIDISILSEGIYIIKIHNQSGQTLSKLFSKK